MNHRHKLRKFINALEMSENNSNVIEAYDNVCKDICFVVIVAIKRILEEDPCSPPTV